jgi:hypothetical protein
MNGRYFAVQDFLLKIFEDLQSSHVSSLKTFDILQLILADATINSLPRGPTPNKMPE